MKYLVVLCITVMTSCAKAPSPEWGRFTVTKTELNIPPRIGGDGEAFKPAEFSQPMPLVIVLPGFMATYSLYETMINHLVSWGYFVVGLNFKNPGNHKQNALQVQETIAWLTSPDNPLHRHIDKQRIAVAGHSLGGKIAVYASSGDHNTKYPELNFPGDPLIKVIIGWDPVDAGGPPCPIRNGDRPGDCRGYALLPESIKASTAKILVMGGQTSEPEGFTCTPRGRTHQAFFSSANAPARHIDFPNAGHGDWIDHNAWFGLLPKLANLFCGDNSSVDKAALQTLAMKAQLAWLHKYFRQPQPPPPALTDTALKEACSVEGLCTIEDK